MYIHINIYEYISVPSRYIYEYINIYEYRSTSRDSQKNFNLSADSDIKITVNTEIFVVPDAYNPAIGALEG
jgi:hypothetical protein